MTNFAWCVWKLVRKVDRWAAKSKFTLSGAVARASPGLLSGDLCYAQLLHKYKLLYRILYTEYMYIHIYIYIRHSISLSIDIYMYIYIYIYTYYASEFNLSEMMWIGAIRCMLCSGATPAPMPTGHPSVMARNSFAKDRRLHGMIDQTWSNTLVQCFAWLCSFIHADMYRYVYNESMLVREGAKSMM